VLRRKDFFDASKLFKRKHRAFEPLREIFIVRNGATAQGNLV